MICDYNLGDGQGGRVRARWRVGEGQVEGGVMVRVEGVRAQVEGG